jgi:hypothetical protein
MEIELPRNTGTDGDGIVRDLREDSDIRDARYGAGPHRFFEMKLIQVGAAKALFGWPLFATWNAWIYASAHHGGPQRSARF